MSGRSILFISSLTDVSGSAVRIRSLAAGFADLGWSVTIAERDTGNAFSYPGIRCIPGPERGWLPLALFKSLKRNWQVLHREKFEVIFCLKPLPNAAWPALRHGGDALRVLDVDDLDYAYYENPVARYLCRALTNHFVGSFDIVTYHNRNIKEHLRRDDVWHLEQGVDIEKFSNPGLSLQAETIRAGLKIRPDAKVIIYIGSLGFTSGLGCILEPLSAALQTNPSLRFIIAGSGSEKESLSQRFMAAGVADAVHFLGHIPHAKIPALLAAADIGVNFMPDNLANSCRCSLKIREYLSAGLQVISNSTGDGEQFLKYITCFNSPVELESILANINHLKKQAFIDEEFKERYDWRRITARLADYLETRLAARNNKDLHDD